MIRTVVREYHWPPQVVGGLFFDAEDYKGLEYWYNVCKKDADDIKSKTPKL